MGHTQTKNNIDAAGFRCDDCGKLLARGDEADTSISIKCTRCGSINSIFKGVTEQVIITDPEGVVIYANSLVEEITGYALNEILGNKPSLWGGQMPKEFYKKLWHTIKIDMQPVMVTVKNKKKDGTLYTASLHISPVFGADKVIKMFVAVESVIK
ncbi:MAG: PAS domain S-box protein [bacterium]